MGFGPETKAIIEAIHKTENCPDHFQVGLWSFDRVGKTNIYKVTIAAAPQTITMTGADVTTQLTIPFAHMWKRVHFFHGAIALTPSNDFLRITIRREVTTFFPQADVDEIYCEFNIVNHIIQEQYGEGFEYEPCVWHIILNSTATDLILPVFYIEKLETD